MTHAETIEPLTDTAPTIVGNFVLSPALFDSRETVDDVLEQIRAEAERFKPERDISTPAGRAAIASFAYKIARSKTALDELGKGVVSEWKTKANAVDAERRRIREDLDALKDDVRAPLDAWEHKDQVRRSAHENALVAMRALTQFSTFQPTTQIIGERIKELGVLVGRNWEEFAERAGAISLAVADDLARAQKSAEQREKEQAERDRREAERLQREQQEREERIAREAREAAERRAKDAEERQAAAEQAQREIAATIAAERVAGHTFALARLCSFKTIDGARSSGDLARCLEDLNELYRAREWQEFAEAACEEHTNAHASVLGKLTAARIREERDRQDREAAVAKKAREAEQQRQADAAAAAEAEQERRENNRRIRTRVRRQIAEAILKTVRGFDLVGSATVSHERIADAIADALVDGEVPHVTVTF